MIRSDKKIQRSEGKRKLALHVTQAKCSRRKSVTKRTKRNSISEYWNDINSSAVPASYQGWYHDHWLVSYYEVDLKSSPVTTAVIKEGHSREDS